jgi:hypothetical protein
MQKTTRMIHGDLAPAELIKAKNALWAITIEIERTTDRPTLADLFDQLAGLAQEAKRLAQHGNQWRWSPR